MKYKNQYMKDLNITSIDRLSEKVEDIFESKNNPFKLVNKFNIVDIKDISLNVNGIIVKNS